MEDPSLIFIDEKDPNSWEIVPFEDLRSTTAPPSKTGFSGLALKWPNLFAASWDRVFVIDLRSQAVIDQIDCKSFSDLHSITLDEAGRLWISNTNLDGIYVADGQTVCPVWHAWEERRLGRKLRIDQRDYRILTKDVLPYHRFHVNAVCPFESVLVCSFLGVVREPGFARRVIRRFGLGRNEDLDPVGGYFIIDRADRKLISTVKLDGIHDVKPYGKSSVLSTQYFTNTVIQFDIKSSAITRTKLRIPESLHRQYLTRGILSDRNSILVGHTQRRGWTETSPSALLRRYDMSGNWLEWEATVPDVVGIYDFVRTP